MRLDDDLQDAAETAGATVTCAARPRVMDVTAILTARSRALRVTAVAGLAILSLAACSSAGSDATTSQSTTESADDDASSEDVGDDATTGEESDAGVSSADGDGDTDGCRAPGCALDMPMDTTCNALVQDCPSGEKCVPIVLDPADGGYVTNVCVPAGSDPIGAPCTYIEGGVNGQDTCAGPGICWGLDPQKGTGRCVEQCVSAGANVDCPISGEECFLSRSGIVNLCLPSCDPLATSCWEGAQCIAAYTGDPEVSYAFVCVPPGTAMPGGPGDPCACADCCQSGTLCEDPNKVGLDNCPEVDPASQACCTALCDITLPDPDLACADAGLVGTVCVALTPPGTPEPLGKFGKCVLPP